MNAANKRNKLSRLRRALFRSILFGASAVLAQAAMISVDERSWPATILCVGATVGLWLALRLSVVWLASLITLLSGYVYIGAFGGSETPTYYVHQSLAITGMVFGLALAAWAVFLLRAILGEGEAQKNRLREIMSAASTAFHQKHEATEVSTVLLRPANGPGAMADVLLRSVEGGSAADPGTLLRPSVSNEADSTGPGATAASAHGPTEQDRHDRRPGGKTVTLTIELNAEDERRLRNARAHGIDIEALIKALLAGMPDDPTPEPQEDRTLALLAQWAEEDATDDPEELARRDAEATEFLTNLRANRLTLPVPKV